METLSKEQMKTIIGGNETVIFPTENDANHSITAEVTINKAG